MLTDIILAVLIGAVLLIQLTLLLILRRLRTALRLIRRSNSLSLSEVSPSTDLADPSDSGVVYSSPMDLKQKRDERIRRGEDPEPADGAIIKTKTAKQRQQEIEASKEARIDKWMPGIKRGQ